MTTYHSQQNPPSVSVRIEEIALGDSFLYGNNIYTVKERFSGYVNCTRIYPFPVSAGANFKYGERVVPISKLTLTYEVGK